VENNKMDLKKFDKNGKPLNLISASNRKSQGNFYEWWKQNPEKYEPTQQDIWCEMQLSAIGNFEQLKFRIDEHDFNKEIKQYKDTWVPYLRREGVANDREGLLLVGLEGDEPTDSLSRPEAIQRAGHWLEETDFTHKTQLYKDLPCLHELLDYWDGLGRTMLIKSNKGGFFPPHRDNPNLTRDCFRVIAFIGKFTNSNAYEWYIGDNRMQIVANSSYYVDTRKSHRTHSWEDDSIHLILNVPKTYSNVMKLISVLRHY
tara:strand:- start:19984 stop:20757 length:774 start_codon:yes stop_codon:yes gene_type:complete